MSYRELRKFTEILKELGYQRLVSLDNFRNPNFELVADILLWLVQKHDPSADISTEIDTEHHRIRFLKEVANLMLVKFHVKLNLRRLYQADGYAVMEMLKIAIILRKAMDAHELAPGEEEGEEEQRASHEAHSNILQAVDRTTTRGLCAEITTEGAKLHDLLGQEAKLRDGRLRIISRDHDHARVQSTLKALIGEMKNKVENMQEELLSHKSDEASLEERIAKKTGENDRLNKQLRSLKSVEPAYMKDFARLEKDLQKQFIVYVEHYRNVEYLEGLHDKFEKDEEKALEVQNAKLKRLRNKLRKEEVKALKEEEGGDIGGARVAPAGSPSDFDDPADGPGMGMPSPPNGMAAMINAASDLGGRPQAASGGQRNKAAIGGDIWGGDDGADDLSDEDDDISESDGELEVGATGELDDDSDDSDL